MAQQRFSQIRPAHLISLVCAAALTACGGGGQPPADTADSGTLEAPASIIIRYAVGETNQAPQTGPSTRQLNVVDTSTGQVVWHTSLTEGDPGWVVGDAHQIDADRQGLQYLGPRQLYYVQGGQVFQMDISEGTLLESRRISSVANACDVSSETYSVVPDGQHDWVAVETAGPDGNCAQSADNAQVMVYSNMPVTAVGPTYAAHAPLIFETLPDSNDQSLGLLTLDATGHKLVVRSTDLKRDLYTVKSNLIPGQAIYPLTILPTQSQMALVQIGTGLYIVDWRSGTATMGSAIATLSSDTDWPIYGMDSQSLYLVDGLRILAISGSGAVATLSTLPVSGTRSIASLWVTPHAVVALQTRTASSSGPSEPVSATTTSVGTRATATAVATPAPVSTLWSIDKSTGLQRALVNGASDDDGWVMGTLGDTVFYSAHSTSSFFLGTVMKVDVQGNNRQTVADRVNVISGVVSPSVHSRNAEVTKLLWCEPIAGSIDCGDGTMVSYALKTGQKLSLGQLPAAGALGLANNTYLYAEGNNWEGAQNLATNRQFFTNLVGSTPSLFQSELWLFDANQTGSLKKVLSAP